MLIIKAITAISVLGPNVVSAIVCNADNVLRALQANSAKASPFCSTYTNPPPNQPLPTYVSQYPASRVSSGCSCLITPTPPPTACNSDVVKNGGFQTVNAEGGAPPWVFALPVNPNSGQESSASLVRGSDGNNYASLKVLNSPTRGGYGTTSLTQSIPPLCNGVTYVLTYDYRIAISTGATGLTCRVEIGLNDRNLIFQDGINFDVSYRTYQYTFVYAGSASPQALTVRFTCGAPSGVLVVDNVGLVGKG